MHLSRIGAAAAAAVIMAGVMSTQLPVPAIASDAPAQEASAEGPEEKAEQKIEEEKKDSEKKESPEKGTDKEDGGDKKEDIDSTGQEDGEEKAPPEKAKPQEEGDAQTSIADALHSDQATLADEVVYQVRIGYEFDDGSFDEWARGTALRAGEKTLITRQGLADTSPESALEARIEKERGESYQRIGVYLNNQSETQKHIKVRVVDTEGEKLDIADIKLKNGMAMINLRLKPSAPSCIFAEKTSPKEIEGAGIGIKAAGNLDDRAEVKTFRGAVIPAPQDMEEGLYVSADMAGVSAAGGILYNENGHVVGMIAGEGTEKPCFTVNAIETFLSTNGVRFRTASEIRKEADEIERQDVLDSVRESEEATPQTDKAGLRESISTAKGLKEKSYTQETFAAVKAALEAAEKADENAQATQAEVNVAKKNLDDSVEALEEKKSPLNPSLLIRIAGIAVIVLATAAAAALVKKRKKAAVRDNGPGPAKKETKWRAKTSKTRKRAPVRETDPEEGSFGRDDDADFFNDADLDITKRTSPKKDRVTTRERDPGLIYADEDGDSRVTDLDRSGKNGTTLLSTGAYLIRKDNGKKIPITSNSFSIGKEIGSVSCPITGNPTVSRIHATITSKKGEYYIEDQNSTNYTFVDGKQIPAYTSVHIPDGSTIRLSDVEMEFRKG